MGTAVPKRGVMGTAVPKRGVMGTAVPKRGVMGTAVPKRGAPTNVRPPSCPQKMIKKYLLFIHSRTLTKT